VSSDPGRLISRLDIRLGVPDLGDDDYVYPVARLLVDGVEMLARASKWRYVGWPAAEILTDDLPLLPAAHARRVTVYVESADPGGLAPQISSDGDVVAWNDFRIVYEAGNHPLDFSETYNWSPAGLPDLVFDARQYAAEVCRATAAREWESDSWQAAVLLRAYLLGDPLRPGDDLALGEEWEVGFAEPDREHAQQYRLANRPAHKTRGSVSAL